MGKEVLFQLLKQPEGMSVLALMIANRLLTQLQKLPYSRCVSFKGLGRQTQFDRFPNCHLALALLGSDASSLFCQGEKIFPPLALG